MTDISGGLIVVFILVFIIAKIIVSTIFFSRSEAFSEKKEIEFQKIRMEEKLREEEALNKQKNSVAIATSFIGNVQTSLRPMVAVRFVFRIIIPLQFWYLLSNIYKLFERSYLRLNR